MVIHKFILTLEQQEKVRADIRQKRMDSFGASITHEPDDSGEEVESNDSEVISTIPVMNFKVLDLNDSELGETETKEQAVDLFLTRHPNFHKQSVEPFIYEI